jgi:outer membrane biogenesis lipoprotein LolB
MEPGVSSGQTDLNVLNRFVTSSTSALLTANTSALSKEEASKEIWEQKQSQEMHYLLIVPVE